VDRQRAAGRRRRRWHHPVRGGPLAAQWAGPAPCRSGAGGTGLGLSGADHHRLTTVGTPGLLPRRPLGLVVLGPLGRYHPGRGAGPVLVPEPVLVPGPDSGASRAPEFARVRVRVGVPDAEQVSIAVRVAEQVRITVTLCIAVTLCVAVPFSVVSLALAVDCLTVAVDCLAVAVDCLVLVIVWFVLVIVWFVLVVREP
jgi:hypothetical protein